MPSSVLRAAVRNMGGSSGEASVKMRASWAQRLLQPLLPHVDQWHALTWLSWVAEGRAKQNLCVTGPRRCGKSHLAHAIAAVMIAQDGFVVRVLTPVLSAPTINFLERAGDGGLVRRLRDLGLGPWMRIERRAGAVTGITFPWGSSLHVHDVGNELAIQRKHGFTGSLYWFDEAQYLRHFHRVLANLVLPTLSDTNGAILVTGTPGDHLGTLYHQMAIGADDAYSVQRFRTWHNPHFGTTPEARWQRILDTAVSLGRAQYSLSHEDMVRLRTLTIDEVTAISDGEETGDLATWVKTLDAELLRQIFGRWVTDAASHVFSWHRVPSSVLHWASAPGFGPATDQVASIEAAMARLRTLAPSRHGNPWRVAAALDIGYLPDPCAIVAVAYRQDHGVAYEVFSGKRYRLADTEMLSWFQEVVRDLKAAGFVVSSMIADAGGMREGTRVDWDRKLAAHFAELGVGLRAPRKRPGYKPQRISALNMDIERGRFRCIAGGDLDVEGMHLRYETKDEAAGPAKVDKHRVIHLPDGTSMRPGNDCLDCLLYAAEAIPHLLADEEKPPPPANGVEARYRRIMSR